MIDFLGTLSGLSILLPALAFFFYSSPNVKAFAPLRIFIYGCVLFEATFMLTSWFSIHNVVLSYPYTLFEGFCLIWFFSIILHWKKTSAIWVIFVYCAVFAIDTVLVEKIESTISFNYYARSINCLIVMCLSFIYYLKIYREEKVISLEFEPVFWFVSGLLFYFSFSFFTFLLSAEVFALENDTIETSWFFQSISNILKNSMLTVGICIQKRLTDRS